MPGAPTPIPGETVAQHFWEGGWGGRARPLGGEGRRVGLSPTLVVSGVDRPLLPWQPDRSLIDSQERTLPCLDPHPFREPLVWTAVLLGTRSPGLQCPPPPDPGTRSLGSWPDHPGQLVFNRGHRKRCCISSNLLNCSGLGARDPCPPALHSCVPRPCSPAWALTLSH